MYLLRQADKKSIEQKMPVVQLMGCGAILREVEAAADILRDNYAVESEIWSLTSINELRRDGLHVERWNRLNTDKTARLAYVTQQLQARFDQGFTGPVLAATDYMKLYADQLREFIPASYTVLGTDGFGRSDTREKLRSHFEVDRYHIVVAALRALMDEGKVNVGMVQSAMKAFGISPDKTNPMSM
jgi:pyruvate dehydrogenase E1 component